MNNTFKKIISVFLAAVSVITLFSTLAFAKSNDYYTYTVSDGKATITKVDKNISGKITIPSKLGGYPVTAIGNKAFHWCSDLKSVTIPNSVKKIGKKAFRECRLLESVTFGSGVTSIDDEAFESCGLKSVKIPNNVKSIGDYAFAHCIKLKSMKFGDGVTSIGDGAVFDCSGMETVEIGKSVKSIGKKLFENCFDIIKISVSPENKYYSSDNFGVLYNKDKTTLIQYPTNNKRKSFKIPNGVKTVADSSFSNASNLTSIEIPGSVTNIGSNATKDFAFFYCGGLTEFIVSPENKYYSNDDFGVLYNKDKTTLIRNPIASKRTSFKIPDSVETVGYEAFAYCNNLKDIKFGKNVTVIENFAFVCTGLETVTIPNTVTYLGQNAFQTCPNLKKAKLSDNLFFMDACIFDFDDNLVEIDLGKAAPTIFGTTMFGRCKSLKTIKVDPENIDFHLVDGALFSGGYIIEGENATWCETLYQYPCGRKDITYTVPEGTNEISWLAFGNAQNLRSIFIPTSVNELDGDPFLSSKIKEIYYAGSKKDWEKLSFSGYKVHLNATPEQMEKETRYNYVHDYQKKVTKATPDKDGSISDVCKTCGKNVKKSVIYSPKKVSLSFSSAVYTGKKIKPAVTVKDRKGKTVDRQNYTVTYSNNKNVGTATVTVKFKGNYSGTLKKTFKIVPQGTALKSVKAKSKGFTASWKKQSNQVTGYEIQYSTSEKFPSSKVKTVKVSAKNISKTISKLKGEKTYYVRVRTYKTVSKATYYSSWSSAKSVKTKK